MTAPTLPGLTPDPAPPTTNPVTVPADLGPAPGTRAARLALPMSRKVLTEMAAEYGVCLHPVTLRRTDLHTGHTEVVDLPCGSTREDKCEPCAKRARRLRQTQIREGWHRTDEPAPGPNPATDAQRELILLRAHLEFARDEAQRAAQFDQVPAIDEAIGEVEEAIAAEGLRGAVAPPHDQDDDNHARRKRSTRRRQDAPDLPRKKVEPRTVGKVYTAPDGTEHRPSMWLSLTLDTYGRVLPDGTPVNPDTYDYRRAAWDAVHFARLLDRFWQNLRRCVGWNVQYAGCVEPQRRLAPHAHFAIRGTIPRAVLRQVAAATYHQVWWPAADEPVYSLDRPPVWDADRAEWIDPDSREPLRSWADALDLIDSDPDAQPAHVVRFGSQVHAEGVTPGTVHANRTIGYITKYITKSAADCHKPDTDRQRDHLDRLWHELRVTPCNERCANWLLYGIQPKKAHGRLQAGRCKGKVHQRATLGIGGRRILVSRDWSGKTLADHRADARAWVRNLLGITVGAADADAVDQDDPPAYAWELARPDDPDLPPLQHRLLKALSQRAQWKAALLAARDKATQGIPVPTRSDLDSPEGRA
ncbi:replication initiator [Micromonospora aurantiaca (nom. illeg.)]|uniref:replication initiator n=1 Tax=Micromonospora aurantiaca (nom. illeg.) TaxID=47850 RepID=UPI0001BF4640|nr:replication initiator [Micromonospora aurantiaca]ADL43584.1 replication initiator protein [Micromonospora aurantiaca ATCC 27029]